MPFPPPQGLGVAPSESLLLWGPALAVFLVELGPRVGARRAALTALLCLYTQSCSFLKQASSGDRATFFFTAQPTNLRFSTALRKGLVPQSLLSSLLGSSRPAGKLPQGRGEDARESCPEDRGDGISFTRGLCLVP